LAKQFKPQAASSPQYVFLSFMMAPHVTFLDLNLTTPLGEGYESVHIINSKRDLKRH
jgi:hypothetical protein